MLRYNDRNKEASTMYITCDNLCTTDFMPNIKMSTLDTPINHRSKRFFFPQSKDKGIKRFDKTLGYSKSQ